MPAAAMMQQGRKMRAERRMAGARPVQARLGCFSRRVAATCCRSRPYRWCRREFRPTTRPGAPACAPAAPSWRGTRSRRRSKCRDRACGLDGDAAAVAPGAAHGLEPLAAGKMNHVEMGAGATSRGRRRSGSPAPRRPPDARPPSRRACPRRLRAWSSLRARAISAPVSQCTQATRRCRSMPPVGNPRAGHRR